MTDHMILKVMMSAEKNGNVFVPYNELMMRCMGKDRELTQRGFHEGVTRLIQDGLLEQEENRLYCPQNIVYEDTASLILEKLLPKNQLPHTQIPDIILLGDITLTEEQRAAVSLALDHRLSIIRGGAGSGKTTLTQAIVQQYNRKEGPVLLCAPTGKAACNIRQRTGFWGMTIHRAFESEYREKATLPYGLVIVDEVSMMSLEMLVWILSTTRSTCRIVLIGDTNQLPSVGCGRVMEDLLELGVSQVQLSSSHRQKDTESMLAHNIRIFDRCFGMGDLGFDGSFCFFPQKDEERIQEYICQTAADLYLAGKDVQVISPFKNEGILSVAALNNRLRERVNPKPGKELYPLHDGDRVMVIRNDWWQNVVKGETGTLQVLELDGGEPLYQITCEDRQAIYEYNEVMEHLTLAYATTVHSVQGSEYDTIIMPISKNFSPLLTRNLFYTAISRAKKRVILAGDPEALEFALKNRPAPRYSMLVDKVERFFYNVA